MLKIVVQRKLLPTSINSCIQKPSRATQRPRKAAMAIFPFAPPDGPLPPLLYLASAIIAWLITMVLYRCFFHPLAKIPGPFFAAITHFYIAYFNLFNGKSQFYLQVEELHWKYGKYLSCPLGCYLLQFNSMIHHGRITGPIIRISPDEIHLSDPENYEKLYYIGSKAPSKAGYFYSAFGLKTSSFATLSNELHRVRRRALSPLFSKRVALQLEDVVQSKVEKLLHSANQKLTRGESVDLYHGFRALSVDVITDYAFDNCYNKLDTLDFDTGYFAMARQLSRRIWFFQAFPSLQLITSFITLNMAKRINIYLYSFLEFREVYLHSNIPFAH